MLHLQSLLHVLCFWGIVTLKSIRIACEAITGLKLRSLFKAPGKISLTTSVSNPIPVLLVPQWFTQSYTCPSFTPTHFTLYLTPITFLITYLFNSLNHPLTGNDSFSSVVSHVIWCDLPFDRLLILVIADWSMVLTWLAATLVASRIGAGVEVNRSSKVSGITWPWVFFICY